jgi:hypothetical protein
MTKKSRPRGRPIGSSNKQETHGQQRAAEFGKLLAAGEKPSAAARLVADKWRVSESTVYTDYKRHTIADEDLAQDLSALQQLVDGALGRGVDDMLRSIAGVHDEATIRSIMGEVADEIFDQVGDRAPHVTKKSTVGGAFRDGLNSRPRKK